MTESKIKTRAKKHDMMLMKDGHGEYYLTDFNKSVVAPGPMSLVQVSLWLDDLDEMSAKTE